MAVIFNHEYNVSKLFYSRYNFVTITTVKVGVQNVFVRFRKESEQEFGKNF